MQCSSCSRSQPCTPMPCKACSGEPGRYGWPQCADCACAKKGLPADYSWPMTFDVMLSLFSQSVLMSPCCSL